MDTFNYKSVDITGQIKTGVLIAKSEQEIVGILKGKNQTPVSIKKVERSSADVGQMQMFKKKVKLVNIAVFCRQLSTMLKAGMPLDKALTTQISQTDNPTLKDALARVSAQVKQGTLLSKAMREQPSIFPKLLINMVESGELTGELDSSLARMSVHFDRENRINRRIRGAMIYPIVLLCLTVLVAAGLLIFVIPTFADMFTSAGSDLPGLTKFIVKISNGLVNYWYIIIGAIILIVYLIRKWLHTRNGRRQFDTWKLNLPVIKKPMKNIVTARFTRTLSTMLSSGIALISAMESAAGSANNLVVQEGISVVSDDLRRGSSLAGQLRNVGVFPEMMISMISIGEETGELDNLLSKTADYYDEEFDTAITKMLSLLEPLMIIFMAAVIGFIVISMYLPLFEVYATLS